jgi:hypothetical protein
MTSTWISTPVSGTVLFASAEYMPEFLVAIVISPVYNIADEVFYFFKFVITENVGIKV